MFYKLENIANAKGVWYLLCNGDGDVSVTPEYI